MNSALKVEPKRTLENFYFFQNQSPNMITVTDFNQLPLIISFLSQILVKTFIVIFVKYKSDHGASLKNTFNDSYLTKN